MSDSAGGPLHTPGGVTAWAHEIVDGEVVDGSVDGALADRERSSADAVLLVLALHRSADPGGLLADVRHALRPGGTLVVVTPSVAHRTVTDLRWSAALRPVRRGPWRHRSALDRAGWLLAAADFAVLTDERRTFALPLPDAGAAREAVDALPAAGSWPDLEPSARARLAAALARRAGPGRHLPVPLRRMVARR